MTFKIPDFSKGTVLGEVKTSLGDLDVHFIIKDHERCYGLMYNGNIVAYVGLEMWSSGYATCRNAYSSIPNKGLATTLLEYVIRHEGIPIFSDFNMTAEGERLWLALVKNGRFDMSIADLKTGEQYPLGYIGKTLPDGTTLIAPEECHGREPKYDLGVDWSNVQRFVYLAEQRRHIPGIRRGPLPGRGPSILQECYLYGDGCP